MEALKLNCENCSERLADFLLDELPESEAILVQEHLNLCPACLRNYKELKGTGMALEAVPSMRTIYASPEFPVRVRQGADVELKQIYSKLPPEKRLRLEARRAARLSRKQPAPEPARSSWNASFILAIVLGVAALAFVIFSGHKESDVRPALGKLSIASGGVTQFYQRENVPNMAIKSGKTVLAGDSFTTLENGLARYDLRGAIVTQAPSSRVTFHLPAPDSTRSIMLLEKGEVGFEGVHDEDSDKSESGIWEVHTDLGNLTLSSDAEFYLKVGRTPKDAGELLVLSGTVDVYRSGITIATVGAGNRLVLSATEKTAAAEPVADPRVPAWRISLLTASDLADVIHAPVTLGNKNENGIEVQINYSAADTGRALRDWIDPANVPLGEKATALAFPAGIHYRHIVPFSAPVSIELILSKDLAPDSTFAFGVLQTPEHGLAVDVGREAVLRVNDKGHALHSSTVPIHKDGVVGEHLRVEVTREGQAYAALLSSSGGVSKSLPVAKSSHSGNLWVEGLSDHIAPEEIKITGTLPIEWLREQLAK